MFGNLQKSIGEWLIKNSEPKVNDEYRDAVFHAFVQVGLPAEEFREDYDLVHVGKLTDVYHLAARNLKIAPELNTVGDVIRWLKS